ncbi:MAG: metal ABC transporter permease [Phycisphaerales bacterium JB040]
MSRFLVLDLVPLLALALSALSCALLGNFLVLRRQALMGDAISHAVLPGLVGAVVLTGTLAPWAVFLGAATAAGVTALAIELTKRLGRVEPGAAMGVVFSVLFALGVLMLERAHGLANIDLDPSCVLYGQPEYLAWYGAPDTLAGLLRLSAWGSAPTPLFTLLAVAGVTVGGVALCFKELRIAAFDPALATTQGIPAGVVHAGLMLGVAVATVAAFEAVGSILVIAMLITPAATARLLTDRLSVQLWLSALVAVGSAVLGYGLAANAGTVFGLPDALNGAGVVTVTLAAAFVVTALLAPTHGVLARSLRTRRLARRVALEDLLGDLYRAREHPEPRASGAGRPDPRALALARSRGWVTPGDPPGLTERGLRYAESVVRRHREWQGELIHLAGLDREHAHLRAHQLEHLPNLPTLPYRE